MAQGTASRIVQDKNGKDTFGGHLFGTVDYYGPTSYVQGGDAVDPRIFGFPNAIMMLFGFTDQSATYTVEPRSLNNGFTKWQLIWTVNSTGAEVGAGTNLSTFAVRLAAIGV